MNNPYTSQKISFEKDRKNGKHKPEGKSSTGLKEFITKEYLKLLKDGPKPVN